MRFYKNNTNHMIRTGDPDPTYGPEETGCVFCGWVDDGGVEYSHLIWAPDCRAVEGGLEGGWLCMECD
jgi:hypothetical protein